ncbi:Hint domain-containing protein [Streptomyces sp. NPDC002265]|uniref:Hint domain-containing protein n=1 Tax=Streptomyces sp. NPDC002265 TaxID=3154415 RepID=UPI00332A9D28
MTVTVRTDGGVKSAQVVFKKGPNPKPKQNDGQCHACWAMGTNPQYDPSANDIPDAGKLATWQKVTLGLITAVATLVVTAPITVGPALGCLATAPVCAAEIAEIATGSASGGSAVVGTGAAVSKAAAATGQCFPAGTPIATADGTKKIEDIKVGDRVWAADPVTGKQTLRRVTRLFQHTANGLVKIAAGGREVRATAGHPFQVEGKGWVDAGDLRPGDLLEKRDGTTVAVSDVSELPGPARVFNFEVETDHTYYATDLDVLVHNTCGEYSELYENGTAILASIDKDGILNTAVEVVKDGTEATAPTGGEMFTNAMNALAKDAEGVRGTWNGGDLRDNLDSFNAGIQYMLSPADAARATFTGKMAVKYGFTKVTIEETVGSPAEYTAAKVVFSK